MRILRLNGKQLARCSGMTGMGVATTREIIASSPHLALPREGEEQKREGRSIGIGGDDEQTA